MNSKVKLKLIGNLEQLKDVVMKSYDYQENIQALPQELKEQYSKLYQTIKEQEYQEFPLLSNLMNADSLVDAVKGFENSNMNEKGMWEDSYDHAIGEINIVGNGVTTLPTRVDGSSIGNTKSSIKINKIQLSNFRFFIDDEEHNTFELNGKNMLLYGENGAGKSSLYKAFEFLAKIGNANISEEFKRNKNIFNLNNNSSINFEFDNDEILDINDDSEQMNDLDFINNLSVYMPLLDYKELLKISDIKDKNLYDFFEILLEDYPVGNNLVLKNLKEQEDKNYFIKFEEILKNELFDSINIFLEQFKQNFKLIDIEFSAGFKKILLKIEYFDEVIEDYQLFLNEARLSALAISVYFSIIKKQFSLLESDSLKILVLDDLLISLDMNNRLHLIDILKSKFEDFQIFLFTHDKAFFELSKQKFNYIQRGKWKYFEMYVDINDETNIEIPHIKKYKQEYGNIARAKEHFQDKDFPVSANYLRKEVEKQFDEFLKIDNLEEKIKLSKLKENEQLIWDIQKDLKKLLSVLEQFKHCERMRPEIQAQKCKEFSEQVISSISTIHTYIEDNFHFEEFEDVKMILKSILHPQSHNDITKPLYKKELEDAIRLVQSFDDILSEEN